MYILRYIPLNIQIKRFLLLFFFFLRGACPQLVEVPGPGIKLRSLTCDATRELLPLLLKRLRVDRRYPFSKKLKKKPQKVRNYFHLFKIHIPALSQDYHINKKHLLEFLYMLIVEITVFLKRKRKLHL